MMCIAEGVALVRQNNVKRQVAFPAQGRSNHPCEVELTWERWDYRL